MATYLHVLKALEYLLDKVGESQWRDWLYEDIELWKAGNDVSHHLSAYGGMGSLNDFWISPLNGHAISEIQEPWINHLLTLLRNLCFQCAQAQRTEKSIKTIIVKTHFSILGFLAGSRMYRRKIANKTQAQVDLTHIRLDGWHCLNCDYQEIQTRSIEATLAEIILPLQLSKARTGQDFIAIVDSTFSMEFTGIRTMREHLIDSIQKSEIKLAQREGWMRPCPECGSHDTEICHWESIGGKLFRLKK
jgi:hypothetical protein